MHRSRTFITLALLSLAAAPAGAQDGRSRPVKRAFVVLGDAIGAGGGGQLNTGTTITQVMRVGGAVRLVGSHGLDLTAVRFQTIFPPGGRLNDLEYANTKGDGIMLSYASLNRTRASGIPNELVFGGGIVRRQTSEPGRTRDTWIARAGYDSDPFSRFSSHADAGVGFHVFLMEGRGNTAVYVASLGLYLRIG